MHTSFIIIKHNLSNFTTDVPSVIRIIYILTRNALRKLTDNYKSRMVGKLTCEKTNDSTSVFGKFGCYVY